MIAPTGDRPPIGLIIPFYGSHADAGALRASLGRLEIRETDEILVADNTEDGRFGPSEAGVTVVRAPLERSSYYARNVGAAASASTWLLFVDSDTRPPTDLLDLYFSPQPTSSVGIVAGGVRASPDQRGFVPRYAASRRHIDPSHYREMPGRRGAGITANLLVRREAWAAVGGFQEGIRSGGDLEFCWRVQDAGWLLEHRPEAWLHHDHVEDLRRLVRKTARHASGGGWVNERYPGAFRRPRILGGLLRAAAGVVIWTVAGQHERARFKGIDGLFLATDACGRLLGNRAGRDGDPRGGELVVAADGFPTGASGHEVDAIAALGSSTVVHADRRDEIPHTGRRRLVVEYAEDDGVAQRVLALLARPWAARRGLRTRSAVVRVLRLAPAVARARSRNVQRIRPLTPAELPTARALAAFAQIPLGPAVLPPAPTSARSSSRSPLP